MALVKFESDSQLDLCIEGIKLAHPNVNTASAAAKRALLRYQGLVEEINELRNRIYELESELDERHCKISNARNALKDILDYQ